MRITKKSQSAHEHKEAHSARKLTYGPPPLKTLKISRILGENCGSHPMGLRRYIPSEISFADEEK